MRSSASRSGDDRAVVVLCGVHGDDVAGLRIPEPIGEALREHAPVAGGNRVGHRLRVVGLDRDEQLREVENDEGRDGE